jgi:DNA invertase Pin-like site-specific DNA recombinase
MNNSNKPLRVVGYVRVSTKRQTLGDSLDAQEEAIREWAAERGSEVVAVYREPGRSGTLAEDERPALLAALNRIRDGEADTLVVKDLDRFSRDLYVQEAVLAKLWDLDAAVWVVTDDAEILCDDPADPVRTAIRQMRGVFNQLERGMITARLQGGRQRKRARGGYVGGYEAYGFDLVNGDLVPREDEQRILAYLREHRPTHSLATLAAALNEQGIPAKRGGVWHPNTVRAVLMRDAERRELATA